MYKKVLTTVVTASIFMSYMPIVSLASPTSTSQEQSKNGLVEEHELSGTGTIDSNSQPNQSSEAATSASDVSSSTSSTESMTASESSEPALATVSFETDAEHPFTDGTIAKNVSVDEKDSITKDQVPDFSEKDEAAFVGWKADARTYTIEDLEENPVDQDQVYSAVFKENKPAVNLKAVSDSIKDVINAADKTKVIVVPSPAGDGAAYKEYESSDTGLKTALFDLYTNGGGNDFVLYVGKSFSVSEATTAKTVPATVSDKNITFTSLQGKVNTLAITGNSDDPVDATDSNGANTLTFANPVHFGTNIQLRNIKYTGSAIYTNGHDLTLAASASGPATSSVYGGTDKGNVSGNPTITVNSTGTGLWHFYGGNEAGGTLKGNPTININNTTAGITDLVGGAEQGTVDGNISVNVKNINGALTNYYGGGEGTTANHANVTGNVSTTIDIQDPATKFSLGTFYGGVEYGDINGGIQNKVSGYGKWSSLTQDFNGGSRSGNIGTDRGQAAITTNLDSSKFSDGTAAFVGANSNEGTIMGSISNTIKAGAYHEGSLRSVNGGAGLDVEVANLQTGSDAAYDAMSPQDRKAFAEKTARFKVYGNITTDVLEGMISEGGDNTAYARGAGYGGYVEGDTTIEVGTLRADKKVGGPGFVYNSGGRQYKDGIDYRNKRPYVTEAIGTFDIVGGGGSNAARATNMYIWGNTKTIHNNDLARWTYGGGFSGIIEGTTTNEMNAGMVSTLEGAGYSGKRVYGNTKSIVNYGEVDWFLSGGGWNDQKIVGNVGVEVHDGIINASMGASYGSGADHTVDGDSHNFIYGGDFSGTPLKGPSAFSGGITNTGKLLGNANLTIDLRNYQGDFKLPSGTSISGGRPYNGTTFLGTSEQNTITLNIYLKDGVDSLAGANVYGDGGTRATNTKNGKITMNIQGVGSNIGHIYATQYSNISGGKILRDVTANIQGAASIDGFSGGSEGDNFTNTIVKNSTNKSVFNFGTDVDGTGVIQKTPIKVNGGGVVNFTQLNVTNGLKLEADQGNISNGKGANAANHGSNYNEFGDIHLTKNAGLAVVKTGQLISGGKLTVEDEGTLESPQGTGVVNLSDFETPDASKDRLTWIKNTDDTSKLVNNKGTWFGDTKGYQVLTINPTKANAEKITPQNFTGFEKATGKTYIGDNDVQSDANGYGVMIPGSVIDYEVENPGIAEGKGAITHDVQGVKENNAPLTISAWGTVVAGKEVQKGRLVVPFKTGQQPKLSFAPDKATGSWLYSGNIVSSKLNSQPDTLKESTTTDPVDWQVPDGEYSYQVKVKYSNEAQLTAKNVIVTEQEASKLATKEDVMKIMEASGRPILKEDITPDVLATIQKPLTENETYRKQPIHYSVGSSDTNKKEVTANLVIVPNDSAVSDDRSFAVYAQDARFSLADANALQSIDELNTHTKAQVIFADDTPNAAPSLPQTTFDSIKNTTAAEIIKNIPTTYSYDLNGKHVEKQVNVQISGELKLEEVPSAMDFGTQKVSNKTATYWPTLKGNLVVSDTRGAGKKTWRLMVAQTSSLTDGNDSLADGLTFSKDGTSDTTIGTEQVKVEEKKFTNDGEEVVNQDWGKDSKKGIKLTVPANKQKVGNYKGTLSWTLEDVPDNN